MRRDLIFFVHGIPKDFLISDSDYFFAPVEQEIVREVERLAEIRPDLREFLTKSKGAFHCASFRNDFKDFNESFSDAYVRLSGILDGYAVLLEDFEQEVWPLIQIREGENADAVIKFFALQGWARLSSKDGLAEKQWDERTKELFTKFLLFFDVAADKHPKSQTELCDQLGMSAKMFRHGRRSRAYGIEFLCKFTALEGLVCGNEQYGKEKMLKERLSALLRSDPEILETVAKMWELRCEASHQGKAFSDEFAQQLPALDRIVTAVIIFALDNVDTAASVAELWKLASGYQLSQAAAMQRSVDTPRFPITSVFLDTNFTWRNAGLIVDGVYSKLRELQLSKTSSVAPTGAS